MPSCSQLTSRQSRMGRSCEESAFSDLHLSLLHLLRVTYPCNIFRRDQRIAILSKCRNFDNNRPRPLPESHLFLDESTVVKQLLCFHGELPPGNRWQITSANFVTAWKFCPESVTRNLETVRTSPVSLYSPSRNGCIRVGAAFCRFLQVRGLYSLLG